MNETANPAQTLDRCATAIAEVRGRYAVVQGARGNDHGVWLKHSPFGWPFYGSEAECQAWIDREAARACIGAQWQLIETARRNGTEFIVYREDAGVFSALWQHPPHEDGGLDWDSEPTLFSCAGEDLASDMPTHCMLLPEPPTDVLGEKA